MKRLRISYGDELLKNPEKRPAEGKIRAAYVNNRTGLVLGRGDIEVEIIRENGADYITLPEEVYRELKLTDYDMDWCSVYLREDGILVELF
jgi:hypothetical protein